MSENRPAATEVNPIVQAASDQVTDRKRGARKDIHAPCSGQLALFDPRPGERA
ncbi:hypothetical protein ACWEPH_22515 [Nocardia beijingensis]